MVDVSQYLLVCFLCTAFGPGGGRAASHWVVTEDGKRIQAQDDSAFQMRRPYDLMAFLEQEKRAETFKTIKNQLIALKREIETDSMNDKDDDVEQLVYETDPDCVFAGKPLVEYDLHVGTLVFAYPKPMSSESAKWKVFPDGFPVELLHKSRSDELKYEAPRRFTIACSNTSQPRPNANSGANGSATENDGDEDEEDTVEHVDERAQFGPDCAAHLTLDFSMTSFEHLPSIRDRKLLNIDAEREILRFLGKWKTYEDFGRDLSFGLKQNSTSWLLYTLASYYWRGAGNAEQAIECARRALHMAPFEHRPVPQLSLGTILHRARAFEEAAIVLHGAIDITPDIPHAHYTLGNIYATLADYNKSVICYENVLKLAPTFIDVQRRRAAVLCHAKLESALKAQHDTLQKTLDELKDYQKQQENWINFHKRMRAEQASPTTLLEQRMHYREFKMRQKMEAAALEDPPNSDNLNKSPKSSGGAGAGTVRHAMTLDELADEILSQPGAKLHLQLHPESSFVDKIVFELDQLEKSHEAMLSCGGGGGGNVFHNGEHSSNGGGGGGGGGCEEGGDTDSSESCSIAGG